MHASTVQRMSGRAGGWPLGPSTPTNCGPEVDAAEDHRDVEGVPRRQQQRLAADDALQLAEGHDRSGEGDRAHEHADEDLDLVDARFHAGQTGGRAERRREAHEHRRGPDEAVEDGDELRHGRHLDARGEHRADAAADGEHAHQQTVAGHPRAEHGHRDRQQHPDDAEQVAATRRIPAPTGRRG